MLQKLCTKMYMKGLPNKNGQNNPAIKNFVKIADDKKFAENAEQ